MTTTQPIPPLNDHIREYCMVALERNHFNVIETAKALDIGKTTLYRWLREWAGSEAKLRLFLQASALRRKS